MKYIIAVLFSALLLWITPTPINNSASKAAVNKTAGQWHNSGKLTAKQPEPVEKPTATATPPETQSETQQPVATLAAATTGCGAYLQLIQSYNWDVRVATAIMQAESGCNPTAYNENTNGSVDRGLFQVNSVHGDKVQYNFAALFNPSTNISIAYRIYQSSGWSAWSAYNNGRYAQFL